MNQANKLYIRSIKLTFLSLFMTIGLIFLLPTFLAWGTWTIVVTRLAIFLLLIEAGSSIFVADKILKGEIKL